MKKVNEILDKTGLESRVFDALSETTFRQYYYICNMRTNVSHWSRQAVKYFDMPSEYIIDAENVWLLKIHPEDQKKYIDDLRAVFAGISPRHHIDYRVKNADGDYVMCTCSGYIVKGKEGEDDLFVGTIINHGIIDVIDPLTNLYNIHEMLHQIHQFIELKVRVSILYFGIKHFTDYNEKFGFVNCNNMLKQISEYITKYISTNQLNCTFYRAEGSRFGIIFKDISFTDIKAIYNDFQLFVKNNIIIKDQPFFITLSGGVLELNQSFYDEQLVYSCLNLAYEKSRYDLNDELILYNSSNFDNKLKKIEIMSEIKRCVNDGYKGFFLEYQPIIKNGQICEAESLLRWKNNEGEIVPPDQFIEWLETDSSFYNLGGWIVEQSLNDFKSIIKQNPDFIININIAYPQLNKATFRTDLVALIDLIGVPRKNICLELTERCRTIDNAYLKNEIEQIRKSGLLIAIDDFGTGFSSVDILKNIKCDYLKIDRVFVNDLSNSRVNQAFVESFIELAHKLDLKICVEGVEDSDTVTYLSKYQDLYLQGFYYSKPISITEFKKLLNK